MNVRIRRLTCLDGVTLSLVTASLVVAGEWSRLVASDLSAAGRAAALVFPVAYGTILVITAGSLVATPDVRRRANRLLVVSGLLVETCASLLLTARILDGAGGSTPLLLVSAAGLVPIALGTLTGRGETPAPDDEPRLMRRSILPGVMFVATAATLVTYTATSQPVGARLVLQGGLLAGSVLIFARQWLAVRTIDRIERERREALERRSRELEAYAYTASHDLKAPLVSIVGFTSAIERSAGGRLDDRSRLYLQRIHANAESLQRLIQDLFEFARAGVDERNAGPVDTAALVEELVAGHHGEARVRVASPLPVVRAHPVRLRQALTNLIDNAVRYGGGQIAISGRADGAWAELVVEDNGPGVPEGERARLFDLFSRGADARTTAPEGTGLGLAVVKKIVEATGGSVRYEPADGARFVLTLPKGSV